ncbi:MAG: fused MFS/spermidine synthase [Clostridia bacterium]|nr:fused MFS/spermidine synthase [Clostridia bacterium]
MTENMSKGTEVRMKKYKLELIVFLAGAIDMGLELIAARVLSPYVGSSNLVWTSIIGIILASMSLGYWIGGKKAEKGVDKNEISQMLLLASVFTSAILLLETAFVKVLSEKIDNLIVAAIICATVVFSIPSLILAMISPCAVKIKSDEEQEIGIISGKISSLSTIGSIVGTFLMGFILIPHIGVSNINIGITIVLIIMSVIVREKIDKKFLYKLIICSCIVLILLILGKFLFKIANKNVVLDTDSEYSRIWVEQIAANETTYKTIHVAKGIESSMDINTKQMGAKYLQYYDLFNYYNKNAKSTLMIGGAAYTYPMYYFKEYKDKTMDVVEIDNKMTQIAKNEFGLDVNEPRLKIYNQDGRTYLNYGKAKYDTILIDAFKGLSAPFELTTYGAIMRANNMLNDNGVVITNVISGIDGKDAKFIKYEYETYKKVFSDVKVFQVRNLETTRSQNLIIVGIKGNPEINDSQKEKYESFIKTDITEQIHGGKIVTDDYAAIGN